MERRMKGLFSFLVALYSSPQCMSKTDLYQRKWNWLHRMIFLVHCAEKHKGDFFSIHHLLSVRVILSKTMPAVDATLAALRQPLKARCITTPAPCSSAGSRAALGEKGSLWFPVLLCWWVPRLGTAWSAPRWPLGTASGSRRGSEHSQRQEPTASSTYHHVCYLHVIPVSLTTGTTST